MRVILEQSKLVPLTEVFESLFENKEKPIQPSALVTNYLQDKKRVVKLPYLTLQQAKETIPSMTEVALYKLLECSYRDQKVSSVIFYNQQIKCTISQIDNLLSRLRI